MNMPSDTTSHDQRVFLHNVSWDEFETMLAIRGDHGGVRIAYLNGELELMSPSWNHEGIKTSLARLLEAWCDDQELPLNGFGAWTFKERKEKAGAEPDECYVLGARGERPQLALEVVWTHGGIGKLEIYRRLQVGEVWNWEEGVIQIFVLKDGDYTQIQRSRLLPNLDVARLATFIDAEDQSGAVRRWRAACKA